jgi:Flp pilus assembly protein TadD
MANSYCRPQNKKAGLIIQGGLLILSTALFGCATAQHAPAAKREAEAPDPVAIQEAIEEGNQALQAGNKELALFHYVRGISLDPTQIDALYKIAAIHESMGNLEPAEKAYQDTLKQQADHVGALEGLGLLQLRKKELEAAKENLTAAVTADPERWRAHNALGVIADLHKDYATSQRHYKKALQVRPGLPILLNNLGYSYYLAGNWPLARSFFEQTLSKDSRYEKAWANLGLLHVRQGDFDKAVSSLRHIMEEAEAFYHVGYILMMEGDYQVAAKYFRKAISTSPAYYAEANEHLEKTQVLLRTSQRK